MKLKKLLIGISNRINIDVDFKRLEKAKEFTTDKLYLTLIAEESNGGYFFNNSLHLYGYCDKPEHHSINHVNQTLKKEYGEIMGNLFCFGQDVFGNQFAFENEKVLSFNIETGEKTLLADNFESWLEVLLNDLEYLTGENFTRDFRENQELQDHRFSPKVPFIVGGEYSQENFYLESYPKYIEINSNIARQVYDLPEGAKIKIKITE